MNGKSMAVAPLRQEAKPSLPPLARIQAHYKKFIDARWLGLIVRSTIYTSLVLFVVPALLVSWERSFLMSLLQIAVLGPVLYAASIGQVITARGHWIRNPPRLPDSTTPLRVLFASLSTRVSIFLTLHTISGALITLVLAAVLDYRSPSLQLGLWNPTPRHHWHLNERLWFLVLGNSLFVWLLAVRDVVQRRTWPSYPKSRTRFPDAVAASLKEYFTSHRSGSLYNDVSGMGAWTAAYFVLYYALRRPVWRFVLTYLPILRPFAINFARNSRSNMTIGVVYYLVVLQFTTLLALGPVVAVLNDYLCQPMPFSSFTAKSPLSADKYLLTALQSKNPFWVNHTVMELQRVAHNQARRKVLFDDTSRPAAIHELFAALLTAMGDSYATLAARGRPAAPKPVAPPPVPVGADILAVKSADIFKPPPKRTGLQALAASVFEGKPAPPPKPVAVAVEKVHAAEVAVAKRVEEQVVAGERWAEQLPVVGPAMVSLRLCRGGFARWAGEEWARRQVDMAVPEPDRLARLVDILATLSIASADEDKYGYVQLVLPSVLEALVRLRMAGQGLVAELAPQATKVARDADTDVRAVVGTAVMDVAERGVRRIAERFGTSLGAFRFPSEIALALTDICRPQ